MKTSFALWIVTLVICSFILIFYAPVWNTLGLIMLIVDVLLGIILFISYILKLEKNLRIWFGNTVGTLISVVVFIASIIGGLIIIFGGVVLNEKYLKIKPLSTIIKSSSSASLLKEKLVFDQVQVGSSGDDVKVLQLLLSQDKSVYSGPISGYFGMITKDGVKKFQKKYGFEQTGIANLITRNKLSEIYSYQTREYWLRMTQLIPTTVPATVQCISKNIGGGDFGLTADPNHPGQYAMPNAPDEKMSTTDELNQAVNIYRRAHGLNELSIDSRLCEVANRRSIEIASDFSHEGFNAFMKAGGGWENTGFRTLGENLWSGSFSGVHIVEYGWDKSPGHQANLLRDWRAGCGGVNGINVAFIFGK